MRKPGSTRRPSRWRSLRPWLFPALALVVALAVWDFGFDGTALRDELRERRIDAALARLGAARRGDLPPELEGLRWWPAPLRAAALQELAATPEQELLESPELPTLVAPLDIFRVPPTTVRLREPAPHALRLRLRNMELGLTALEVELPAGTQQVPLELTLIPGTSYSMELLPPRDPEAEARPGYQPIPLAFAGFVLLGAAEARETGLAMAAAHGLAPDEPTGSLLAAIVALEKGCTDEALERLRPLAGLPGCEDAVRELTALALAEQGLDRSALALLRRPD